MPNFFFDRAVQRYRKNNGKFVSAAEVAKITQRLLSQAQTDLSTVTELLIDQKINVRTFTGGFADVLKVMHTQAYLLGRGGLKAMTPRDYGIIGAKLGKEYRYLDQFAKDAIAGKLSIAQFRARAKLYATSANTSYEMGRRESHSASGRFNWEKRNLAPVQHCDPCVGYAAQGWQPINTLPAIGADCDCRANCKCAFTYSADKPDGLLSARFGWLNDRSRFGLPRVI
jgi:hypothetical protein